MPSRSLLGLPLLLPLLRQLFSRMSRVLTDDAFSFEELEKIDLVTSTTMATSSWSLTNTSALQSPKSWLSTIFGGRKLQLGRPRQLRFSSTMSSLEGGIFLPSRSFVPSSDKKSRRRAVAHHRYFPRPATRPVHSRLFVRIIHLPPSSLCQWYVCPCSRLPAHLGNY